MPASPHPPIPGSGSEPAPARSWGGPLLILAGVLIVLWGVPIVVDSIAAGPGVLERVVLFLLATSVLGCGFLTVIAARGRRGRRR